MTDPQQMIDVLNPGRQLPPGADPGRCAGCGYKIGWLPLLDRWGQPSINPRTGLQKKMPIDPGPLVDGNVRCQNGTARVITAGELVPPNERYVAHFATCPKAAEFRKGRGRGRA